ncbi:hypothetical protein N0V90_011919 [Kalmusia sp. IMI 367209]|nr:hypothetical protein N0V90_011919 [Kalmusia sp. IMI 367209]
MMASPNQTTQAGILPSDKGCHICDQIKTILVPPKEQVKRKTSTQSVKEENNNDDDEEDMMIELGSVDSILQKPCAGHDPLLRYMRDIAGGNESKTLKLFRSNLENCFSLEDSDESGTLWQTFVCFSNGYQNVWNITANPAATLLEFQVCNQLG